MTRVTLCVDALEPHPGGIGRYTWELCQGLAIRDDVDLLYFGRNRRIADPSLLLRGERLPRRPGALRNWWDKRTIRSSVVHGPNYFLPAFVDRGVVTVHDLSVFRYPETHPPERVAAFERELPASMARAAHIITDTETVRQELITEFGIQPERVSAIALGVDSSFHPRSPDELSAALGQWGLSANGYGLCVSTLEPRKKILQLLSAWRRLPVSLCAAFPLVLCGGSGWRNEALREQIEQGIGEGWLKHLGFVDEALLPAIYAGAALFVYPSIYEGFGLPPLEAMASGVPVLVSQSSCMPEVCGDVARYLDPDDPAAFTTALERGLTDRKWQLDSADRGVERARGYSWDRCIEGTVQIYRKVAMGL